MIYSAEKLHRAYIRSDWKKLAQLVRMVTPIQAAFDLTHQCLEQRTDSRMFWRQSRRLSERSDIPRLQRQLATLVCLFPLSCMCDIDPPGAVKILNRWESVLKLSKLTLIMIDTVKLDSQVFQKLVKWIEAGARAKRHEWMLDAVKRRELLAAISLERILSSRERLRFQKLMERQTPDDVKWYQDMQVTLLERQNALSENQETQPGMECSLDLV